HQIGINVIVGDGAVLIRARDAVDTKISVEIEVPERAPQTGSLDENIYAHIVPEGIVARSFDILEYRDGDIRIDVKCRGSGRPIARTFFSVDRSPGKGSPGQIKIFSTCLGRVEDRASPTQGVCGTGGRRIREHRQDVEFGVPERMPVISGAGEAFGGNRSAFRACARRDDVE